MTAQRYLDLFVDANYIVFVRNNQVFLSFFASDIKYHKKPLFFYK